MYLFLTSFSCRCIQNEASCCSVCGWHNSSRIHVTTSWTAWFSSGAKVFVESSSSATLSATLSENLVSLGGNLHTFFWLVCMGFLFFDFISCGSILFRNPFSSYFRVCPTYLSLCVYQPIRSHIYIYIIHVIRYVCVGFFLFHLFRVFFVLFVFSLIIIMGIMERGVGLNYWIWCRCWLACELIYIVFVDLLSVSVF